MLLDFTVENFRSIKGAETLSAVAQKKRGGGTSDNRRRVKSDDEIAPPYHMEGWDIDVLPVIAIFGANASGKSNVLKALDYLLMFMGRGNSLTHPLSKEFNPFKLDKFCADNPTYFEIRTAFNGTIYTYSLKLDQTCIHSEKLEYALATTKRPRLLFERNWNQEFQIFEWKNGSDFSGSHIQLEKSLNLREPFISLLSRLKVPVIESLTAWIGRHGQADYFGYEKLLRYIYAGIMFEFPKKLKLVENLLCQFDTGLIGIELKKVDTGEDFEIYAIHNSKDGEVRWRFEEESTGTQRLFTLICQANLVLGGKSTLIIDELGSNIHPNITREIVRLFQNPKTNPKRAQLIFTSHDNTLQRNNLLRRDQIWFTKKRSDQSTELYPLSDFKVRNDLAIDKAYLDGRFGAVPFISDDEELISSIGNDNA